LKGVLEGNGGLTDGIRAIAPTLNPNPTLNPGLDPVPELRRSDNPLLQEHLRPFMVKKIQSISCLAESAYGDWNSVLYG